jgi:hypothetical protein
MILIDKVKLRNGIELTPDERGNFKPIQEIDKECKHACSICPIYEVCEGNNEFDCMVYGMFSGCYFYLSDLVNFCNELKNIKND